MKRTTIELDLHDPRLPALTEALGNKTAKVLLEHLSTHALTISELVNETRLPFSTVDYTVKKLVGAGLVVQESKWWSVKGKSVVKYTLANTTIVISPRPLMKGILPAILGSGLFAAFIRWKGVGTTSEFVSSQESVSAEAMKFASSGMAVPELVQPGASLVLPDVALWFLFGSLIGIVLMVLWNAYLGRMKGGVV